MSRLDRYKPGDYICRATDMPGIEYAEKFTIHTVPDNENDLFEVTHRGIFGNTALSNLEKTKALPYDMLTDRQKFEYELSGRLPKEWCLL